MIDDDFESVFRRVFESLKGSLGEFPDGAISFSFFAGSSFDNLEDEGSIPSAEDVDFERIDLEDYVLFLINIGSASEEDYAIKVEKRSLKIIHNIDGKEIQADLDFDVDIENSRVSSRNGVMEISLKIAKRGNSGKSEGYLKTN